MNLRRRSNKRIKILVALFIVLIAIFAVDFNTSRISGALQSGVGAILNASVSFLDGYDDVSEREEIAQLKKELKDTLALRYENILLKRELSHLRAMFATTTDVNNLILSRVLSGFGKNIYGTILVSSNSDIKKGDIALAGNSVAVGVVHKNSGSVAVVELFSSNGYVVNVFFASPDEDIKKYSSDEKELFFVEAKGMGGGMFILNAPKYTKVREGDLLISKDANWKIVGEVTKIEEKPEDPTKTIIARVPVDLRALEYVAILGR